MQGASSQPNCRGTASLDAVFLMPVKLKTLLAIGGSDPLGGAGIQADIRAGVRLGIHVSTAVTAVTVQNSKGLLSLNPVSSDLLDSQLRSIFDDLIPEALKVGMVGSLENANVVSRILKNCKEDIPVVVDPLLKISADSSASSVCNKEDLMEYYQNEIFPYATVVTPNLEEADDFLRLNGMNLKISAPEKGAELLRLWKCNAVILKGGHSSDDMVTDYFADSLDNSIVVSEISYPRIACANLHGTGCTYASLIAGYLALGFPLSDAFRKTSASLHDIISASCDYRLGESDYGPLNVNSYIL